MHLGTKRQCRLSLGRTETLLRKCLTLSGPAFSVVRQAQGGLRGPDAKNQG